MSDATATQPGPQGADGSALIAMTSHTTPATTMRALVQHTYGPPDVVRPAGVPVPEPAAGQVRVRVRASSVNARDWHIMRGEPRVARLLDRTVFGRVAPRIAIRGTDLAGRVDAVGPGVSRWRVGDRVFGEADAAWADYAIARADAVTGMPDELSFEQAAAMPLAGTTALTCLDAGEIGPGGRLLMNGASGGVGTFALQLAAARGLGITAVCSARNADQARALGADTVIDYASADFCATTHRYDMVLDLVGNRSVKVLRRLVRPAGALVLSGGGVPGTGRYVGPIGALVRAQLLARRPGPRIVVPQAQLTTERLDQLLELVREGALRSVIDRVFQMEDGADAVRYVESEHASGKVVLVSASRDYDA